MERLSSVRLTPNLISFIFHIKKFNSRVACYKTSTFEIISLGSTQPSSSLSLTDMSLSFPPTLLVPQLAFNVHSSLWVGWCTVLLYCIMTLTCLGPHVVWVQLECHHFVSIRVEVTTYYLHSMVDMLCCIWWINMFMIF